MATKCPKCHTENPETSLFCSGCGTKLDAAGEFSLFQTETLETPLKELRMGSTFADRYQIIEELGKGGMGKVYKVLDTHINEKVALKLLKPEIAADRKTIERFSNELKFARKIRHKNVCGMYDLGKAEGTDFITMEYVQGEDLKSMIRMAAGLSIGAVLSIGKQICDGLAEAHALGVVHRDLKPQNIMIDKGGNAKIMDFGIARSIREKGITGPSVLIGTPEYMSPEQAEAKEVDNRSDIYSLGIILYEMATGRVPFEGDTALSIAMKHKGEIPKNPKQFNANIPDDLGGVILKCLEKDRARRYQTAAEVQSELEKIEKGIPTTERVVPERRTLTSREITLKFNLKKLFIPAGIVLLAVCSALVFLLARRGPRFDPSRIIVTVFENQTGEKSLDTLGRMASDWITQGLSRTGLVELVNIPPSDVAPGSSKETERIYALGREAGAGTLVSGSYFLQGKTLTFQARLSDLKRKKLVRALDPVNGEIENPVEAIDVLRQKVMGALAAMVTPESRDWFESQKGPLPTYEAYQELIEGFEAFYRWDLKSAMQHYDRANELDSSSTAARAQLAIVYGNLGENAKAEEIIKELEKYPEALSPMDKGNLDWLKAHLHGDLAAQLRAARQGAHDWGPAGYFQWAVEAMRNNYPKEARKVFLKIKPEGPWMKEMKYLFKDRLTLPYYMLDRHKEELERARRLRKEFPESLSVLYTEMRALAALGRMDEINVLADESLSLPPELIGRNPSFVMSWTAEVLLLHGHKNESLQLLEKALKWLEARTEAEKETKAIREQLGYTLYLAEKWGEAKTLFEKLLAEEPENVSYLGYYGALAAKRADKEEAQRVSENLRNLKTPYLLGGNTYWRACIAAILESKEEAVRLLRESISQGVWQDRFYEDANMVPLLDFPAYKELMKPKG